MNKNPIEVLISNGFTEAEANALLDIKNSNEQTFQVALTESELLEVAAKRAVTLDIKPTEPTEPKETQPIDDIRAQLDEIKEKIENTTKILEKSIVLNDVVNVTNTPTLFSSEDLNIADKNALQLLINENLIPLIKEQVESLKEHSKELKKLISSVNTIENQAQMIFDDSIEHQTAKLESYNQKEEQALKNATQALKQN